MRLAALLLAIVGILASTAASAQWVMLARHVVGRVEQMSQSAPNVGASYDTATVILDAPADKIYETALRSIKAAPGITLTSENASHFRSSARTARKSRE